MECAINICNNLDESQNNYDDWNDPEEEKYHWGLRLCEMQINLWWQEAGQQGGMEDERSQGTTALSLGGMGACTVLAGDGFTGQIHEGTYWIVHYEYVKLSLCQLYIDKTKVRARKARSQWSLKNLCKWVARPGKILDTAPHWGAQRKPTIQQSEGGFRSHFSRFSFKSVMSAGSTKDRWGLA